MKTQELNWEQFDRQRILVWANERGIDMPDGLVLDKAECFFPYFSFVVDEVSNGVYQTTGKSIYGTLNRTYHIVDALFFNTEMDALSLVIKGRRGIGDVLFTYLVYKATKNDIPVRGEYVETSFGSFVVRLRRMDIVFDGRDGILELRWAKRILKKDEYAPIINEKDLALLLRKVPELINL